MLDLYKLRLFMAVADQKSISKGAEAHFMSQSAMSQHIAQLEAMLGRDLFARHRRGVTLTPDGKRLYDYANQILTLVAEAELALFNLTPTSEGQLALGATPGISTYRLPLWISPFTAHYPRLNMRVQTDITGRIVTDVLLGKLDLGMVEGDTHPDMQPKLHVHSLESVQHMVIVGKDHAWWGRDSLSISELQDGKFIMRPLNSHSRRWLDDILKTHHIKPSNTYETDNIESIKWLLKDSHIAVLPNYVVESDIASGVLWGIRVSDVALIRDNKVLWDKSRPLSPIARAFLGHLGTIFPTFTPP